MDSYHKVVVPQKRSQENEIFVNSKSPASHLLSRVLSLFKEKNYTEVTFRATGGAISTAVTVAELTKRRIEGLHQITTIGTTDVSSVFEPTIEGLEKHEQTRLVSSIVIQLSTVPLDAKTPGYQAPLSATEFAAAQALTRSPNAPRRGGRTGPRAPRPASGSPEASSSAPVTEASSNTEARRGRGGRRGGRGPRPEGERSQSGSGPSNRGSSSSPSAPREQGDEAKRGRGGRRGGRGGRGGRGPRPPRAEGSSPAPVTSTGTPSQ